MPNNDIKFFTIANELQQIKDEEWVDDGGTIEIRCSACDSHLVSLVITRSNAPVSYQIVAKCCHCNDKSFIYKVKGIFAICQGKGSSMSAMDIVEQTIVDDVIHMRVLIQTRK